MAKKSKKEEGDAFIRDVKDRYRESVEGWQHVYDEATDDLRFVYDVDGGQWSESAKKLRKNRPMITSNKLQKVLRRIRGDGLMNRPRMSVIPVDSVADPGVAKLYDGIFREIEYLSAADIAYDTAYNHALSSSVGFFRIITQFIEGSFDQEIRIKRIINPQSVHFDPYAVDFNLEDAEHCFYEDLLKKDRFKSLYPKATVSDFDSSSTATLFGDWMQGDKVRVCEYFKKETFQKKIGLTKTGLIIPLEHDNTARAYFELTGDEVIRDRMEESHIVKWYKLSGGEILDENVWPGKYIPVVPMFGDEVVVEGKRYFISLARGGKGPQEMYNYWASAATEAVAAAPKNPFMVDHRQIKGFEKEWESAHLRPAPFVRYKAIPGMQKPSREPQAQVPTAILGMMQSMAYDIEDHLGQYESSKGEASNERSRVAIDARINQSDKGTYLYVNNRTRAMVYGGRQIVDLIPKIYETERALVIMGEDGQHQVADVNVPSVKGIHNDLSIGRYDLISSPGASFSSQRQEMVSTMERAMQYAGPDVAAIIAPLLFKYSDSPGSKEIADEITKRVDQAQAQAQQQGPR
jgi:hypothetical protein